MAAPSKLAGKAGTFVFNGTTLPFTVIKPKTSVDLADSTDSANYDPTTGLVHKSQIAAAIQTELSVEGFFDLNTTDQSLITQIFNGTSGPVLATINLSPTKVYGHGPVDISDFECEVPVLDVVKWTATLKTNGIFVRGS